MKNIIIFMLVAFMLGNPNVIIAEQKDAERCDIESWFSFFDECYDDIIKNRIKNFSEDEYVSRGGAKWIKISESVSQMDSKCDDYLRYNLDSNLICFEFMNNIHKFLYYSDYEDLVLRCYYRHLTGKEIKYQEMLDSLLETYRQADSLFAFWARADTIEGAYIPKDLDDAIEEINKLLTEEQINTYSIMDEDSLVISEHLDLGMYIRNRWCLWGRSRLADYLYQKGIDHPDYMSDVILRSWHRFINKKPINLDQQIIDLEKYKNMNK